ncbi:hypothetical protein MMC17_007494 [Xylographa soralifera]|nr:hypothetical protein [Xylographa soralifera]
MADADKNKVLSAFITGKEAIKASTKDIGRAIDAALVQCGDQGLEFLKWYIVETSKEKEAEITEQKKVPYRPYITYRKVNGKEYLCLLRELDCRNHGEFYAFSARLGTNAGKPGPPLIYLGFDHDYSYFLRPKEARQRGGIYVEDGRAEDHWYRHDHVVELKYRDGIQAGV